MFARLFFRPVHLRALSSSTALLTALMCVTPVAQAHDGPHDAAAVALLQHAISSPDHWLASLLMLAVAVVLGATAWRLWSTAAGGARRGWATACLGASGLLLWSVARTAAALTL